VVAGPGRTVVSGRPGVPAEWAARRQAALGAVAAGIAADWLLGEPPAAWHPVAAFGRAMQGLEARCYADSRRRGLAYAATGAGVAALAGSLLDRGAGAASAAAWRRQAGVALATYVAVAGRALAGAANEVAAALAAGDIDGARARLPSLVGREPDGLDQAEIVRAVVESVAENTVDAVVAAALWAACGGAAAVLAYRAVNTLDAMVGHRSPRYARFGWAAARADDLAGWLPARLTALLVVAVRPGAAVRVWAAVRHQAGAHPSPNAGVAEAAFAAALGVRLGGANTYGGRRENRPWLGTGSPPRPPDIARAIRLSRHVTVAMALLGLIGSRPWRSLPRGRA
jgi:adenosylcobinamide-phosphate synthase